MHQPIHVYGLEQGTRLLEIITFPQKTGDVMSANFLSKVPLCSQIVLASFSLKKKGGGEGIKLSI